MTNYSEKEKLRVLRKYQEIYDASPDLQALEASSKGDIDKLKLIFFIEKKLNIFNISISEKWNWLHNILLLCNHNEPSIKSVYFYIEQGVPINAQDVYGMTPLHYALRGKNIDAAIALLKAGADPNIPNRDNLIPLRMAIAFPERLDMLELMLKNGGNVHYFNGKDYLLEAIKWFKGDDPDPKYKKFIEKLEEYA